MSSRNLLRRQASAVSDAGGDDDQPEQRQKREGVGVSSAMTADSTNADKIMEDLVDKLKLLDYEVRFCRERNQKPLSRAYFSRQSSNPNEQRDAFIAIVAWLFGLSRVTFTPSYKDDPNQQNEAILQNLKHMGVPVDFPPTKLKQPYGDHICTLLDNLAQKALGHFEYMKPSHTTDDYEEEADVDDEAELNAEMVDDGVVSEEEDYAVIANTSNKNQRDPGEPSVRAHQVVESQTDPAQWRIELERVAPMLKLHISSDNKEWRTHLEQTKQHDDVISAALPSTREQLEKLAQEVQKSLDKIATREKLINERLSDEVRIYRENQDKLAEINKEYTELSDKVNEDTNTLQGYVKQIDEIKDQMDYRGSSMTDTKPVMRIKDAIAKLRKEIKSMDLRIGVVECTLLTVKQKLNSKDESTAIGSNKTAGGAMTLDVPVDTHDSYEHDPNF
eukprot:GFYU01005365.1.p1 GENE.GFYU01005365.1~~GFYU01005365.1.p1  ORF type:complete len:446 (+),score=156.09 GFYU01005365.1:97-1434(+)